MKCYDRFSKQLISDGIANEDVISIQQNSEKIVHEIENSLNHPAERLGLLFGQVQSGKTNNIIMAIARAIDRGHKFFVVLTSDNTWLYGQTLGRIQSGLRSIGVFGKDDWRNDAITDRIQATRGHGHSLFLAVRREEIRTAHETARTLKAHKDQIRKITRVHKLPA